MTHKALRPHVKMTLFDRKIMIVTGVAIMMAVIVIVAVVVVLRTCHATRKRHKSAVCTKVSQTSDMKHSHSAGIHAAPCLTHSMAVTTAPAAKAVRASSVLHLVACSTCTREIQVIQATAS